MTKMTEARMTLFSSTVHAYPLLTYCQPTQIETCDLFDGLPAGRDSTKLMLDVRLIGS